MSIQTKDIPISQAISFEDGEGGKALLSLAEGAILRNLQQSLLFRHLVSPISGSWDGKGTVKYNLTFFSQTQTYNESTGGTRQKPKYGQKFVHVDQRKILATQIEDFDRYNISGQNEATLGQWIANCTVSVEADLKAQFLSYINKEAKANPKKTIYLEELFSRKLLSKEAREEIQNALSVIPRDLGSIFTDRYLNVPTNEFQGVFNNMAGKNIDMLLTGLNCSKQAFSTLINGYVGKDNAEKWVFNGIDYYTDNLLGMNIAQGASINGDYAITFKTDGFYGFVAHRDAFLFPFGKLIIKTRVAENFNDELGIKYECGFGIAYDELWVAITDQFKVWTNSDTLAVGNTMKLGSNGDSLRTITYTSSDETKATVDANGLITGVAAGSVDITAKFTNFAGVEKVAVKTITIA